MNDRDWSQHQRRLKTAAIIRTQCIANDLQWNGRQRLDCDCDSFFRYDSQRKANHQRILEENKNEQWGLKKSLKRPARRTYEHSVCWEAESWILHRLHHACLNADPKSNFYFFWLRIKIITSVTMLSCTLNLIEFPSELKRASYGFKIGSLYFEELLLIFFASYEKLILFSIVLRLLMSDKIFSAKDHTNLPILRDCYQSLFYCASIFYFQGKRYKKNLLNTATMSLLCSSRLETISH